MPVPLSPIADRRSPRLIGAVAALVLFTVYSATIAPGLTWWDAGEFIAAVHTFGIPHPPGTPLYVALARAWRTLVWFLPTALATNLLSSAAIAMSAGLLGSWLARSTNRVMFGLGAALCAGSMSTVWLNATETEVYAISVLLSVVTLVAADRAGRSGELRWKIVTAYLLALAAPLHVSALVAGPAAVVLASSEASGRVRRSDAAALAAVFAFAVAVGTGRWTIACVAFGAAVALPALLASRPAVPEGRHWRALRIADGAAFAGVAVVAVSALAVLLVRASHDPAINQGNAATFDALAAMVERRQYAIAGIWPRQAPAWLQVANVLEYADWQVALGITSGVRPSVFRTPWTLLFAVLALSGARAHRGRDRRTWRAMVILLGCATLGVVVYLNFKAGPTLGYGILPDTAPHEARERDYFFVLAFLIAGAWAGIGAVHVITRKWPGAVWAGVALAALPIVLNWRAVTRRHEPDASLPAAFGRALLESAPRGAILFVAGDNDTYPLWYLREVEGVRPDVTTITVPLLGAEWYRAELARRWSLGHVASASSWRGMASEIGAIVQSAVSQGRPIAAAATLDRATRDQIGAAWIFNGLVFLLQVGSADIGALPAGPVLDSAATRAWKERLAPLVDARLRESTDPTAEWAQQVLRCPHFALSAHADSVARIALESTCNFK